MKVFLSWSGERSKAIAMALKDWLPVVLRDAEPWLSHTDIAAGERWSVEVAQALEASDFGIICLTNENLTAPWLLFEAGAVAKKMLDGAVVPYLFDVDFTQLTGPLAQFQGKKADKESTLSILHAINAKSAKPENLFVLGRRFELTWLELHKALCAAPSPRPAQAPRPEREILEEMATTLRGLDRRIREVETILQLVRRQPDRRIREAEGAAQSSGHRDTSAVETSVLAGGATKAVPVPRSSSFFPDTSAPSADDDEYGEHQTPVRFLP
jgi:hypothetical protein